MGRIPTGMTKTLKIKVHPDIYYFLTDVAKVRNISLAEVGRRIIYESVNKVAFPEDARKVREFKENATSTSS